MFDVVSVPSHQTFSHNFQAEKDVAKQIEAKLSEVARDAATYK